MKIATLCYIKKDDKTLMMYRNKKENDMHQGKWNGLGGKLIPGETPEECVIREVKEESGLKIEHPLLKGILTFPAFDSIEDWYVFLFVSENFSGSIKYESDEGSLKWINNKDLFDLNLWEGDKIFMKLLEQEKFFSLKLCYKNGKLISTSSVFY